MSARLIVASLLVSSLAASGCGPSYSDTMRKNAHTRLGVINAELNYDQALQAFNTGQFEKSEKLIKTAIVQDSAEADYSLLLGRICIETNRLENAIAALKSAVAKNPEDPEPHYYSGIVYQRWSDDQGAFDAYWKAFELDDTSVFYLLAAAESLVAMQRYDEARDLLEPKLAYFEHNSAMRQLLGQIAMLEGDPKLAAAYLEEAHLFNPEDDLLLEELAHVQYAAGQFAKSLRSVRQLMELIHSRRPDLMHFEARCLARMDRVKEAYSIYQSMSGMDTSNVQMWVDFGALAWELEDYHRLALCGARVAALAPERYEGYFYKGVNEHNHGNLDEAIQLLRDAVARCEDSVVPCLALGRALEDRGDTAGARTAYNAAKSIDPADDMPDLLLAALDKKEELATVPAPEESR